MTRAPHLTPTDIVDLAEGRGTAALRAHAADCPECQAQIGEMRTLLRQMSADEVPEPSPLFWDHLSARVSKAIDEDGGTAPWTGRAAAWLRPRRTTMAALAVGMVVLAVVVVNRPPASVMTSKPAWVPHVAPVATGADATRPDAAGPAEDDSWALVAAVTSDLEESDVPSAGLDPMPGNAERAVEALSNDERRELVRLLQAELARHPK